MHICKHTYEYQVQYMPTRGYPKLLNRAGFVAKWLYLDAEVLVLPSVFYPQDSCFVGRRLFVVNQLPPTRSQYRLLCWCGLSMRGVSVIPRAVSLRVSIRQSTGILGIPLPALLSNTRVLPEIAQISPTSSTICSKNSCLKCSLNDPPLLRSSLYTVTP